MKNEKLFKNKDGEYLYLFNWVGGGFNDVWAPNKKEAYRRVVNERKEWEKQRPTYAKLRPDYKSMRRCTLSQYEAQNRMGWLMTC